MRRVIVLSMLCLIGVTGQVLPDTIIDSCVAYVYTFNEMILFSYEDVTDLRVFDIAGDPVWGSNLNADEFYRFPYIEPGPYRIWSNHKFSVLAGDNLEDRGHGWYAADFQNLGASRKFLTVIPENDNGVKFIVFAHQDSTEIYIRDLETGTAIDSAVLDSAGRLERPGEAEPRLVTLEANKPVSALSYGDQGYWVPASNGSFIGNLFFTWVGYINSWQNDLSVIAYEDSTFVRLTGTDNGIPFWQGNLDAGQAYTVQEQNQYITIESDKDISCLVAPYESFSVGYSRYYQGIDVTGLGGGTFFYHPTIPGTSLHIFSLFDENSVHITQLPDGPDYTSPILSQGELMTFENTFNGLLLIESNSPIVFYDAPGGTGGGVTFAPVFGYTPAMSVKENLPRDGSINIPSIVAGELTVFFSNTPSQDAVVNIYNAAGQLATTRTIQDSREIVDISNLSSGVYFVTVWIGERCVTQRVILH